MAQYNVTLDQQKIKELLIQDEGLKALVESVVNQVLEVQLTEQTWKDLFEWLKRRGLKGVDFVISVAHKGIVRAIQSGF